MTFQNFINCNFIHNYVIHIQKKSIYFVQIFDEMQINIFEQMCFYFFDYFLKSFYEC